MISRLKHMIHKEKLINWVFIALFRYLKGRYGGDRDGLLSAVHSRMRGSRCRQQ